MKVDEKPVFYNDYFIPSKLNDISRDLELIIMYHILIQPFESEGRDK